MHHRQEASAQLIHRDDESDLKKRQKNEDDVVKNRNSSAAAAAIELVYKIDAASTVGDGPIDQDDDNQGRDCGSVISCISRICSSKSFQLWTKSLMRLGFFFLDLALDFKLIITYGLTLSVESDENRNAGEIGWYFWLTLIFVFVPALFLSILNGKYYLEKHKTQRWITKNEEQWVKKLKDKLIIDPNWKFFLRGFFCINLVSPLARYSTVLTL